jgi:hypothetical protein
MRAHPGQGRRSRFSRVYLYVCRTIAIFCVFFLPGVGYNKESPVEVWNMFLGMSDKFWVVILVLAMLLTAILTAAYQDDKTKGL